MRVAVIGATGNVGTAVLRRLVAAPEVTEIVGIARRKPDIAHEPYTGVTWRSVDVGSASAVSLMTEALLGVDAVIHLAWALQPNHNEPAMRRTNVRGLRNVLAAVVAAGVPQIAVASSVGAYSPGPKRPRVDENWPTGGLPTSHYAQHKARNERALDAFEAAHPQVTVTRLRPGLIFQRDAGNEIAGLFLGQHFPTRWLTAVRIPVLPFPSQGIFQAVHADDVADAFWRSIDRRAGGAFNIAAEPVLDPQTIAQVLGARRSVPVRARVVRGLVELTWRLRLQATDPGWIDIAVNVPVMSTDRARQILGWQPTVTSTAALAEIVDAVGHRHNLGDRGPLGR
jgi:UDP-glucose 4-epimerase